MNDWLARVQTLVGILIPGEGEQQHHEAATLGTVAADIPVLRVDDEAVLRLAVEDYKVEKRVVESGRVQVRRTTSERVEQVREPLRQEQAEVRRVPIDKVVEKAPKVRETADEIVIPVVEEVLVVERRLVLREEIHIKKKRTVTTHTEDVVLRSQQAEVVRLPPQTSDTGNSGAPEDRRTGRSNTNSRKETR